MPVTSGLLTHVDEGTSSTDGTVILRSSFGSEEDPNLIFAFVQGSGEVLIGHFSPLGHRVSNRDEDKWYVHAVG